MSLWSRVRPYAWAVLGTAIAIICRLLMVPVLGTRFFYGTLYVAVVASAMFGGLGPALVATLLGAVAFDYFMIPPQFAFGLGGIDAQLGLALYLVISAILIGFAEKQRRKHQQLIVANEERFRRLLEVSAQTVWVANARSEIGAESRSGPPLTGRSPQRWLGVANWLDAVHPDDRERVTDAWLHAVQAVTPYEIEFRMRNASGEYRYMTSHAAPVFDPDGTVREWIGMSTDITERKRAEQALADAIQRLNAHMKNSPLAVIEFDRQLVVTRWSEEAEKVFGWTAAEILGRPMYEIPWIHNDDSEAVGRVAQGMLDGTHPRNLSVNRNCRKDGTVLECEWYNSAIYDRDGNLASILSQVLDITDKRRTEERLRQAQKMESIGVLAGGIAHDFNNLLASVIGNASLAVEMLPEDSPAEDLLERAIRSGEQAAHLTMQMLAYSGKGRFVIEPVDLSAVVRQVTDLVRASAPKKITIRLDLDPELPPINTDRNQLHQVLINLVTNAAEAIGDETGLITVRTGLQYVGEDLIRELEAKDISPGRYVLLEVGDTGSGMNDATKAKIFDPFFSTKFTGRGLGLAAVSGIVRGHRGAIKVSTAPGKGTCFTVFLPAANAATETPGLAGEEKEELRGTGTVLFVDDEEALRQMAKRGLEHHGFEVLLASDGHEAVDVLKTAVDRVGAVVLDLSMPVMSGQETLPELQKVKPGVQVLVSSGYGKDNVLGKFAGSGVAGFIQKPYTVQQLVRKVNEAIAGDDGVHEKSARPRAHG